MPLNFELVDAAEVMPRMLDDLERTKGPVGIQSMHMAFDSVTNQFFDRLEELAVGGVISPEDITIVADAFSLRWSDTEEQKLQLPQFTARMDRFSDMGATAKICHPYSPWTWVAREAFRNHRKGYRIGDTTYTDGGVMFSGYGLGGQCADFILRSTDEAYAKQVGEAIAFDADNHDPTDDKEEWISTDTLWLEDGGRRNKSCILDCANWIIERAEPDSIYMVSQLYPNGTLAEQLTEKDPVALVTNKPELFAFILRQIQRADRKRTEIANVVEPTDIHVHAKAIAATLAPDASCSILPEGGPVTLSSSNNLNTIGPAIGTKEKGQMSLDPRLHHQVVSWITDLADRDAA